MITILLLTISNVFMTFAWYGHLKFAKSHIVVAILVSWLIAFFEYCFQVPANRIGHRQFEAAQLKIMQEVITLIVFAVFATRYLKEPLRWNYLVGFALILAAVIVVFAFRPDVAHAAAADHLGDGGPAAASAPIPVDTDGPS
jgi:uncharacterized protein (DUF486 family)